MAENKLSEDNLSIEEKLNKIEEITEKLSSGELSLQDSLKEFEAGIKLVRESEEYLDNAEKRLQVLREGTDDGTV